jgi:HEAT repeat protein
MSGAWLLLVVVAPLRLTFWVLAVGTALIALLIAIGVARHLEGVRDDRRREHVRLELEPIFSRFLETEDREQLAGELRPAFLRMDAAHRPVAAVLVTDLMRHTSPSQKDQLRGALEHAGIVELGERGTRRLSPWRRALACEMLGKIGAHRSVPPLLARLDDRRPEVRIAAVRALGEIGSKEAVPALSEAFLERRVAPTNIVNNVLRRIGSEAAPAFEQGVTSQDPIVRLSSCFGLSGIAGQHGAATVRLSQVLASDSDTRVRAAAAAALGIVGGGNAPVELLNASADPEIHVRRAAVKALGSFDDPTTAKTLVACSEDEDRETAIRAAEALLTLASRPRAAPEARALLESSSAWAVEYARTVAEVSA